MKTEFQNSFKLEHAKQIAKIYHPELTDEQMSLIRFGRHPNYTWIEIDFKVKGYGQISIGIDNHWQTKLFGDRITKEMMAKALSDGTVNFSVWRFSLDKFSERKDRSMPEAISILKNNYKLPSVEEFCKVYYSD